MHAIVRVSKKVKDNKLSTEERLRLVEDELGKMRQLLAKLVEKGSGGSSSDPLTEGDRPSAAVTETEPAQPVPEEEAGSTENTRTGRVHEIASCIV